MPTSVPSVLLHHLTGSRPPLNFHNHCSLYGSAGGRIGSGILGISAASMGFAPASPDPDTLDVNSSGPSKPVTLIPEIWAFRVFASEMPFLHVPVTFSNTKTSSG